MPRQVRDATLETRTARSRLQAQHRPYYRLLSPGLHLGYRKLASGPGTWVARRYLGDGTYVVGNLRTADNLIVVADDFDDADNVGVLSFAQAQDHARRVVRPFGRRIADKRHWFAERGIEPSCFLYRHYDAHGDLLYVGMSLHVWSRQIKHLQNAEWANSIYQIVIEPFASREELIEAEAHAIKTEYPKFNKTHNGRSLRRALVAPENV